MPRIKARDLHEKAMQEDAEYRREYETLEEEFSLISAILDARGGGPVWPKRKLPSA